MALNVNEMGGGQTNNLGYPRLGPHISRLVGVVAMGVQERRAYKGETKAPCGRVNLTFELTDDFVEIEGVSKPRWISKTENAFSGPQANLPQIARNLDPANTYGGDLGQMALAGVPCMVTVEQKRDAAGNVVDGVKIGSITGLPPGMPVPALHNQPLVFDFDNPTEEGWDRLQNWQKDQGTLSAVRRVFILVRRRLRRPPYQNMTCTR